VTAEAGPETGWFRCENGQVLEMDLPLHEGIGHRVAKGEIVRVAGPDGGDYIPDEDAPDPSDDPGEGDPIRPAQSAVKADWIDYAVAHGADRQQAEAMTKDDLVQKYGGS
jgi:hypothetical protein